MRSFFHRPVGCAIIALSVLGSAPGQAAASDPPDAQAIIAALSQANTAVVGVHVSATSDARSIDTLGKKRSGSGVVIGPDGLILTIGYLLLEAQSIQIVTQDNKSLPAQAVAYDQATGFGLIRPLLPLSGIEPVKLGSLENLELGEALMAATGAQANGVEADVSMTHLVSKRAFSGYWEYHIDPAIFTSPPVDNHSGAPLFNQHGELIGIGSLFVFDAISPNRQLPGNMFVPVDLLKPILLELRGTGSSKASHRPWLGLTSMEKDGRVQVQRVNKESPAQAAGLQSGDVILAVDGASVATLETFYKKLWDRSTPDADVQLTVLQGAKIRVVVVRTVDRMNTLRKAEGI
jgi:serine protease Do